MSGSASVGDGGLGIPTDASRNGAESVVLDHRPDASQRPLARFPRTPPKGIAGLTEDFGFEGGGFSLLGRNPPKGQYLPDKDSRVL